MVTLLNGAAIPIEEVDKFVSVTLYVIERVLSGPDFSKVELETVVSLHQFQSRTDSSGACFKDALTPEVLGQIDSLYLL